MGADHPRVFTSIPKRKIDTPDERLAWLLIVGTIPVGITGLVLEHFLRTVFAKPSAAAAFLLVNGVLLLLGERLRRQAAGRAATATGWKPPAGTSPRSSCARRA